MALNEDFIINAAIIDWGESCESKGSDRYDRPFIQLSEEIGKFRLIGDLTSDFDC